MTSIQVLSEALTDYEGTIICVSHSRDFIDEFCSHIMAITDDGAAHLFEGKLEDYQRAAKRQGIQNLLDNNSADPTIKNKTNKIEENKLDQIEIKELKRARNSLTKKIDKLSHEQDSLNKKIEEVELMMSELKPDDYERLLELQKDHEISQSKLEESEEMWLELSDKLESIETKLRAAGRLG